MREDKEIVLSLFRKNFSTYSDIPIAIYGIGEYTKYIVENFTNHNIVGLMDESRIGETVYDKSVLSFDDILLRSIKLIVIVARPGNVKVIYNRIAKQAKAHNIEVFDLNGTKQGINTGKLSDISFKEYLGNAYNQPIINEFLKYSNKNMAVDSNDYNITYTYVAPIVVRFFWYLVDRVKSLGLDSVLLSSRDGYIIEKLYHIFNEDCDIPDMKYFYTSRSVCVLAGVREDADIEHAAKLAFHGTTQEMLVQRFLLPENKLLTRIDGESDVDYILRHKERIFYNAAELRKCYQRYINTFDITYGARVGFFDFVSSGTCQKALSNIVNFDLTGIYMAALCYEASYKSSVKIEAMYGILNVFDNIYCILGNYFLLENIMSSFESTLSGFDTDGSPLFYCEYRTEKDFTALREAHRAIIDYAVNMQNVNWSAVDIKLPDFIFGLLDNIRKETNSVLFKDAQLRDEFCKREFTL